MFTTDNTTTEKTVKIFAPFPLKAYQRLVDLKHKPLEEFIVTLEGKSILSIVIIFIECVFWVRVAVIAVGGHVIIVI